MRGMIMMSGLLFLLASGNSFASNYGYAIVTNGAGKVTQIELSVLGDDAEAIYASLASSYPNEIVSTDPGMNPEISMPGLLCGLELVSNGPVPGGSPMYECTLWVDTH